jgi:RHS repeat-associated protein
VIRGVTCTIGYAYNLAGELSPVTCPSGRNVQQNFDNIGRLSSVATYYHPDQLSNRLTTDSSGNVVAQMGHYPFGDSWYNSTNDKLQFTTYSRDAESSNDYAMARSYINRLGRFSSPDLLSGSIANPQSLNRYSYVQNDPTNLLDPLGLNCVIVAAVVDIQWSFDTTKGILTITGVDYLGGQYECSIPDRSGRPRGGGAKSPKPGVNLNKLNDCTKQLYGITANQFAAAIQGQNGSPGLNGFFSGTLNDSSGLQFNFTVLTDVNSYEAPLGGTGSVSVTLGKMNIAQPFVDYVSRGFDAGYTLLAQVVELGNSLTAISGVESEQQMVARDNSPNPNPLPGVPFGNDAPGLDLLKCLIQNKGITW